MNECINVPPILKMCDKIVAILFFAVNLEIILLGTSMNAEIALGFPYRYPEKILAFDRTYFASRITIIIIVYVIVRAILIKYLNVEGNDEKT